MTHEAHVGKPVQNFLLISENYNCAKLVRQLINQSFVKQTMRSGLK